VLDRIYWQLYRPVMITVMKTLLRVMGG